MFDQHRNEVAFGGIWPSIGPSGKALDAARAAKAGKALHAAFACVELRGDWKWHMEILGLARHYKCVAVCHMCTASTHAGPNQCPLRT